MCQIAGVIGSFFTAGSLNDWYAGLNKPSFTPPDFLFAPVWIVLYLMMGISLFLVWKEGLKNADVKSAFYVFIIQLILNTLWSAFFFGFKSTAGGLIVIVLLWISILVCILKFKKISAAASYLLIPYLLWVSFASVLNGFLFTLN